MTNNEQLIYNFIKSTMEYGASANQVAEVLELQRSNVSAILNRLQRKGYLEKIEGRPVLFKIAKYADKMEADAVGFRNLIGYEGTNKHIVELVTAALLYPKRSLDSIIIGQKGSGISYFASLMHNFLIENRIISDDANFLKFNCKHYVDDVEAMGHELFGICTDEFQNIIERTNGGFLFIDHIEFLSANARNNLLMILEERCYIPLKSNKKISVNLTLILSCSTSINNVVLESFVQKIPVRVELPPLRSYSLEERLQLINQFFEMESIRMNRKLAINSELLVCLLLYDCDGNIKQLRNDIQLGCANAYVRDIESVAEVMPVFVSDFNHYVRKGFLHYKINRDDLLQLISEDYNYTYDGHAINRISANDYPEQQTIYDEINTKVNILKKRGLDNNNINRIISAEFETMIIRYKETITNQVSDLTQLSKLVDPKLIRLVSDFLDEYSNKFHYILSATVLNGLCLHINEILSRLNRSQMLSNEQIMAVIENHRREYLFCLEFVSKLEQLWNVKLPIDEVVFITMFINQKKEIESNRNHPALLIAMHGEGVASSISKVVQSLTQFDEIFSFDLPLDQNVEDAYIVLKQQVERINNGKGVLVIYDMGSIQTMCVMIQEETGIPIRTVNVPITMIAIDIIHKIIMDKSIDVIHNDLLKSLQSYYELNDINTPDTNKTEVIVTICTTGEGSAKELKKYLEQNDLGNDYQFINLSSSDRNELYGSLDEITKQFHVKAIIGAVDPKYKELPFIPLKEIFQIDGIYIKDVIEGTLKGTNLFSDLGEIYAYLGEQLKFVNIEKIRSVLPKVMFQLNRTLVGGLSIDKKMGLFIHIACAINRLIAQEELPVNIHKDDIITDHKELFYNVTKSLKPLERVFKIVFTDNEVANIVAIMKEL